MAENGITQAELDTAVTYLTGAYPLRFDGNAPIAGILVGMQMTGLTPDYIKTRNDKIRAIQLSHLAGPQRRIGHCPTRPLESDRCAHPPSVVSSLSPSPTKDAPVSTVDARKTPNSTAKCVRQ